ncbi:MAG: hypothetical protein M3Q69_07590 [Acidobacteriota bacterium]|nr:hypothetical protein [Acidobacteriota bacterium]
MKTIAIVSALFLLLSACASSDGFQNNQISTCAPGDPIGIDAGFQDPGSAVTGGRLTLLVQVANNSDADITVASVRADPQSASQQSRFEFTGGTKQVNRDIAEGEEATFEIPMNVRIVDRDMQNQMMRPGQTFTAEIELAVTVKLANGDASRCRFRVAAPVQF